MGSRAQATSKAPSKKDMAKILKFSSFAAKDPLCAQKVGAMSTLAVSRGEWRERDMDITYSG